MQAKEDTMPIELGSFSLGTVVGGVVVGIFNHYLTKSRNTEERKTTNFNQAATTFRSKVLAELEGLYPSRQGWSRDDYSRFKQTIPGIETSAQEFRFHVEREKEFDTAAYQYCSYCKRITWDQCTAWSLYPTMRKAGELPPWAEYDHLVKNLLSFAQEK